MLAKRWVFVASLSLATVLGCRTAGGTKVEPAAASEAAPGHEPTPTAPYAGQKMADPAHLTKEMRDAVSGTMKEHGDDMTMLMWSLLFLELDSAAEAAQALAARPPLSGEEGGRIHPQMVVLGAEFREKANRMSELATGSSRDAQSMSKAFGELAETCVRCHSVFLYEKPPEK